MKGLGKMKSKVAYQKLDASFNLRVGVNPKPTGPRLASAPDVYEFTKEYAKADREIMLVVMVDTKNALMSIETHSIGCIDSSAVYPREIFRSLLLKNASSFILVHNHPSGDPEPSFCDKQITEDIKKGADILQIKLLDHIILGRVSYYSMAEHNEGGLF